MDGAMLDENGPRILNPFADLAGAVVIVTGASSGLGHHFARMLAGHGVHVAVAARRFDLLVPLVEEIRMAGGEAEPVAMDVTDIASVRDGVARVVARFGTIDGLVNNAGIARTRALLDEASEEWVATIDTNLTGARHVACEVARAMIAAGGGGAIVNVVSILGLRQGRQVGSYATSKAGLIQLTKQMALEWARHGIRVNALAPGYVETDLNRDVLASEAGAALLKRIPQRRFGRMQDLDAVLLLLLSSASAYMTGAVIPVDGGHLLSAL